MKAEWHKIQDKIPERLESVIGCSLDKAGNLLIGECWYIGNNQFYFFGIEEVAEAICWTEMPTFEGVEGNENRNKERNIGGIFQCY